MLIDCVATRADLEAVSTSIPTLIYVQEVDAWYSSLLASALTPDGWCILTAPDGCWKVAGKALTLPPIGDDAEDDWENFGPAINACAPLGIKLLFGPSQYYAKSQQFIPSYARIEAGPLTRIECNITDGDSDPRNSPFLGFGVYGDGDTLAANTNIGDKTVTLTSGLPLTPGMFIVLTVLQFRVALYEVLAYDSDTKIVTLDRPLRMAYGSAVATTSFPAGATVNIIDPVRDVLIDFSGAHVYGTCSRFVEFISAWKCNVRGPAYLGDGTEITAEERIASFDAPSYDCHGSQIYGDGGGHTPLGLSFESSEASSFHDCEMRRIHDSSATYQDAQGCVIHDSQLAIGAGDGVTFTAAGPGSMDPSGSIFGANNNRFIGGSVSGHGGKGVLWDTGSAYNVVDGATIQANGSYGARDAVGSYNLLVNAVCRLNAYGVHASNMSYDFSAINVVAGNNNNNIGVENGATSPWFDNVTADYPSNAIGLINGSLKIGFLRGSNKLGSGAQCIDIGSTGAIRAARLDLNQGSASAPGTVTNAGLLYAFSGKLVQKAGGTGINTASTGTTHLGEQVEVLGQGSSGAGVKYIAGSYIEVCPGARIDNYSIKGPTAGDSVPTLDANALYRWHI